MRPLLSQFQAPAASRKVCRFFRAWLLSGLRRPADHPAYFGLAILCTPTLSARRELRYKRCQMESMPVFCATVEEFVEIAAKIAKNVAAPTCTRSKIAAPAGATREECRPHRRERRVAGSGNVVPRAGLRATRLASATLRI